MGKTGFNPRVIHIADLRQAARELEQVGADRQGCRFMAPKAVHRLIKVERLTPRAANLLKQEMLARGGEAAVSRGVADWSVEYTDALLMGTVRQFRLLIRKLKLQPFGLARLAGELEAVLQNLEAPPGPDIPCGPLTIRPGSRTYVMGILNVTPDSFSDGGHYNDVEAAVARAREMVDQGADIIDIGAESTRPGHSPLSAEEELARLLPVLEHLQDRLPVPISVDTYKPEVAREALRRGACIINDVGGLYLDPEMAKVAAEFDVPLIIMHGLAEHRQGSWPRYPSIMGELVAFFRRGLEVAAEAGVSPRKVIIDPGIGFGKIAEDNLEIMNRLAELRSLGRPILVGTSRKSTIGKVLDLPVGERLEGTAATVALCIAGGADIVRVHDVKEMVRVARMSDAVVRWRSSGKAE